MSAAARDPFRLLARNEFRLYLRSGQISGTSVAFFVITQVVLHFVALGIALATMAPRAGSPQSDDSGMLLAAGLISMLLLMTSRALAGAVQSLYTRGDLDLLLSSPVDRRAVIGVRTGTIALTVAMEIALLVFPFANVFVLFGRFAWFKAYLLVPGMAMLATSIGLAATLLSFRMFGPRRTRVVVQVMAVLVGTAMMLAFYLPSIFGDQGNANPYGGTVRALVTQSGVVRDSLLALAGWVGQGFLPTMVFLVGAALLLATSIHLLGDRIVAALVSATGGSASRRRASATHGTLRFRGGIRFTVVLKELKLIARDPFLIAQILQQSLFVLPMAFALWRMRFAGDLPLAWLSVVWLAAGLAGPLAWLTLLAEDAPDLLASAPVSRAALMRAKIEAALLPALPVCVLPLFFLLGSWPWYALCVSGSAFGASLTLAILNMRNPTKQKRDSFKTRHRGNGAHGLVEALAMFLWVGVAALLTWLGSLVGWR